ncbi:MAG: protein MraZ [Candidatus Cloacimonetes bacterium]|jgi:DNA-binding transcriptional regulator/RsmH inhibitor MraZ|nr:protein MraZ [Candidatus Cloacimonadota bacterium]
MSGEFLGTFENSVNKMRVIIPAVFKSKFATSSKQTIIATIGANKSIAIYPLDNWILLKDKLKNGDERAKRLLNNLIDFACPEQQLEGPGRIRISDELLEITGISDSVIIKGEGSFISLWNPQTFKSIRKAKLEEHQQEFNSMDYQV